MANFGVCFNFMMDAEDAPRAFRTVPDTTPVGMAGPCMAIAGINSCVFGADFAKINALAPGAARGPLITAFYQSNFWNSWYDKLLSTEVGKRVFDESVNAGSGEGVKILQTAIHAVQGAPVIAEDGEWGPVTLAANGCDPAILVPAFIAARIAHYKAIWVAHPGKWSAQILAEWIARASR